jgi:hypothetical protein
MKGTQQSIELDCPPGGVRPWDLIAGVVEGTSLILSPADLEPGHTFFGHRTWLFEMDEAEWAEKIQPIIKPRIEALFKSGTIRYGSW